MNPGSKASPTILLTLAEFAWLVVFALLLLVKGTRSDLQKTQAELAKARPSEPMSERLENLESELVKSKHDAKWQTNLTEKVLEERNTLKKQLAKLADDLKAQTKLANEGVTERNKAQAELETLKSKLTSLESKLKPQVASASKEAMSREDARVLADSLKSKLSTAESALKELARLSEQTARERDDARVAATKTKTELERFKRALDGNSPEDLSLRLKQLKDSAEKHAALIASHVVLKSEIERLKAQLQSHSTDEFTIRQEIIGIEAKHLGRVAILLDTSSSMSESTAWKDARRLVQVWLTHLPIEECVLISFNSKVQVYPKSGYLRIRRADKSVLEENRRELLRQVNDAALNTFTDTLRALETAYTFRDVEMILLFTDGKPQTATARYETLAPRIYNLVKEHGSIPINAIGLGDYEKLESDDRKAGKNLQIHFLKEVARLSGGNFIAR